MLKLLTDPSTTPGPVPLGEAAFLFAGIARFTVFTEIHGDACAAELAWRMRLGVEEQLGNDAHVIKMLGDAVMVRVADPAEAAAAGLRIVSRALPAAGDPPIRVGIHWGQAIELDGDYIGAAVNVAARIASLAEPGEVLISGDVAIAARGRNLRLEEFGECRLRNVASPVLLYAVRGRAGTSDGPPPVMSPCALQRRRRDLGACTRKAGADVAL